MKLEELRKRRSIEIRTIQDKLRVRKKQLEIARQKEQTIINEIWQLLTELQKFKSSNVINSERR